MALTSASTIIDAEAQLKDNLRWHGSLTTARDALEAVDFILAFRRVSVGEGDLGYSMSRVSELKDIRAELASYVSRQQVNHSHFTRGVVL